MRYGNIDSQLFKNNRERFVKQMKPNSVALFFSSDQMPKSADAFHVFKQNPDIFHLTGIDQEDVILAIFPDAPNPEWREVLFVKETNEHIRIWEGDKVDKKQATQMSGIQNVQWINQYTTMLPLMMNNAEHCYLHTNEHDRYSSPADYGDLRHVRDIIRQFPLHKFERSAPIMHRIRSIKSDIEVELIRQACNITKKGFERILKFIKPGVWEYEVEAELAHEFLMNRSRGFAYEPIIATGHNANVLHYVANESQMKDGELVLLDIGAEFANYASDLSRTIPVGGRYNTRQKEVYNAVLRVFKAAKNMLRPGNVLKDYHEEVGKLMEKELIDLGLLTTKDIRDQDPKWPAYKKYFMHGTSHFLGLDVHDVGNRYLPMVDGMVFTCEPGIYIREEGIGVRIENDILISHSQPVDLMEDIPIEVEHIEDIMNSK